MTTNNEMTSVNAVVFVDGQGERTTLWTDGCNLYQNGEMLTRPANVGDWMVTLLGWGDDARQWERWECENSRIWFAVPNTYQASG